MTGLVGSGMDLEPGHVPMVVRARLQSGVAQAAPWGIALDGLLAAQLHAHRRGAARDAGALTSSALEDPEPEDLPLPLAACRLGGQAWHWAATCLLPERAHPAPPAVHTWTGRVDSRAMEQLTPALPQVLSERQGRYRARRMPLLVSICAAATWTAVGDPQAVLQLLQPIAAIGKKRATGEGRVLGWEVHPRPDLDPWAAAHLHPDGSLGRPSPAQCLAGHEPVVDGGTGQAGLRPPSMHPSRRHLLRLPRLLD